MQPFYGLTKNLNAKVLSGALVVLALALFIPFSSYLTQQRVSTSSQAGSESNAPQTSIILAQHQFDCNQGDPQNGIPAESDCNKIEVGKTFAVDVLVRSDIDPANLVNVKINYPTTLLSVEKIVTQGPQDEFFINSWVNRNYNNDTGLITLIGSISAPGFITQAENPAGIMARLYFKLKTPGQPEITVDPSSAVYRSADNSNILNTTKNFSFTAN